MTSPQPNKFELLVKDTVLWIRQYPDRFWSIVGAILIISLIAAFSIHHRKQQNSEAWTQLGAIQSKEATDAPGALKALEDWSKRFQGTRAAPYAQFLKADLLYKTSDYTSAAQTYGAIAQGASVADMRPLALFAQESALEMAGQWPQARELAKSFTERYPDHFLAASSFLTQARLAEKLNDPTAAVALYDRFTVLYPQSPYAPLVKARQQLLRGPTSSVPSPSVGTH